MSSRKQRGAQTQRLVAGYFQQHGWPFATAIGGGAPGRDIENMPGLAPEVKARRDYNPTAWLKQAHANAWRNPPDEIRANATPIRDLPFVVHRPDGYGPTTVDSWPVTLTLADFADLLREAGYGDPVVTEHCSDCSKPYPSDDLLSCANDIPGQGMVLHCPDCEPNCGPCRDEAARDWQDEHGPRSRT